MARVHWLRVLSNSPALPYRITFKDTVQQRLAGILYSGQRGRLNTGCFQKGIPSLLVPRVLSSPSLSLSLRLMNVIKFRERCKDIRNRRSGRTI